MKSGIDRQSMPDHIKIGLLVGGASFLTGMFLMFISMGLPIGNILLAIPIGIITGRLLIRGRMPEEPVSKKLSVQAGFISGALSALGVVVPLVVIALMAPKGATIWQEFSKWIDPNLIP